MSVLSFPASADISSAVPEVPRDSRPFSQFYQTVCVQLLGEILVDLVVNVVDNIVVLVGVLPVVVDVLPVVPNRIPLRLVFEPQISDSSGDYIVLLKQSQYLKISSISCKESSH